MRSIAAVALLVLAADAAAQVHHPAKLLDFERTTVDGSPVRPMDPWGKAAADLDGDGRDDMVVGGYGGNGLQYYVETGGVFVRHQIAGGSDFTTSIQVVDMDGDGDLDVLTGTWSGRSIVWYRNPSWQEFTIGPGIRAHDILWGIVAGQRTIFMRDQGGAGNGIEILRQTGADPTLASSWRHQSLPLPSGGEGIGVFDMDGDGTIDAVAGDTVLFLRDDASTGDLIVDATVLLGAFDPDTTVSIGDLNGDGRPDVMLTASESLGGTERIAAFLAMPQPRSDGYVELTVDPARETVLHSNRLADFNRDGSLDLVTAEMHQGDQDGQHEVSIYLALESPRFARRDLYLQGSHALATGDFDGDGRLDFFGANHSSEAPDGAVVLAWMNVWP